MSTRLASRKWIGLITSLVVMVAMLIALPVSPLGGNKSKAHASVASGDLFYTIRSSAGSSGYDAFLVHQHAGTTTTIADVGGENSGANPAVSPDGSKIAFTMTDCYIPNIGHPCSSSTDYTGSSTVVVVMNTDGSNETVVSTTNPSTPTYDTTPRWTSDGNWVYFEQTGGASTGIYKVHPNGTSQTQVISDSNPASNYAEFALSPDGTKIAYDKYNYGTNVLYVSNVDGSSAAAVSNQPSTANTQPEWTPNGNTLVFESYTSWMGSSVIDSINTDGSGLKQLTPSDGNRPTEPTISPDGSTVLFSYTATSQDLYSVPMSGTQSKTDITSNSGSVIYEWPTYVPASYPAAEPGNSAVTIQTPSKSDAPYTRQISIGLSNSGIGHYDYGWSTSNTTAPTVLQQSTNVSGRTGTLNYLGVYSGSSWSGGTTPNTNEYLWIRSVQTGGTANAWATPLLVHTPNAPAWVAVGDSYSSGHHQTSDQPWCPSPSDTGYIDFESYWLCGSGLTWTPNDSTFSWVSGAMSSYNTTDRIPLFSTHSLNLRLPNIA